MLLKNLRLNLRLARARRHMEKARHEQAHFAYVSILNAYPEDHLVHRAYAGLAATEYERGKLLNSRHYARLFIDNIRGDTPDEAEVSKKMQKLIDTIESELYGDKRTDRESS